MATSDLHVHVLPYDYFADRVCNKVGLARTATLIAQARNEVTNSILVDNGDFLQGNPLGDYIASRHNPPVEKLHPMIAAMNRLRYDAATVGNHEFNYGLDYLDAVLAAADFPVVLANVREPNGQSWLPPFVLLDRQMLDHDGQAHPLRIGIIGFTPPQIAQWDRAHLEGRVTACDIHTAAQLHLPRLKAAGADIIVALSHSGIGAPEPSENMENASTALAALPWIDAVVAGHSHLIFPSAAFDGMPGVDAARGTLAEKPAVMPGFNGSHLGIIDLTLQRGAAGWQVTGAQSMVRSIATIGPQGATIPCVISAAAVEAVVAKDHAATLKYARRSVGHTDIPLNTHFAFIAPNAAMALVAEAQSAHVARALAGHPDGQLPLLSATAPYKAGGRGGPLNYTDIAVGEMALRHAADLYLFPNTIAALRVTGADVAGWLERMAGVYHQIRPGLQDQPLLDLDFPGYNFDMLHGVSFAIDLLQPSRYDRNGILINPAARRIRALRYQGRPIAETDEFIIATNSYRASGSGDFPGSGPAQVVWSGRDHIRDLLLRHIVEIGKVTEPALSTWQFVPQPGATVTIDTAIHADLATITSFAPVSLGVTGAGFRRLRLQL